MIKTFVTQLPDPDITETGVRYERVEAGQLGHGAAAKLAGWFRYSHEGLVLATGEHNYYDDSDFYALVWDAEAGRPREVEYATTRGWTYANSATVDATPEIVAAYDAYRAGLASAQQAAQTALEAATPRAGKTVRVVKGRKVPVGTVAEVTWYGEGKNYNRYSREAGPMRVGLQIDGATVWTDASNVEVIGQIDPATLPLVRVFNGYADDAFGIPSQCPVCGTDVSDHEWWDTRAGIPETCSMAS